MAGNKNLHAAAKAKKDEFYTRREDIENELWHYREHFRGKTVLCNCDDPYESNFFKYFALNFNALGLRRLICTCYDGSPVAGRELQLSLFDEENEEENSRKAYLLVLDELKDMNGDGAEDLRDVDLILKENPPTLLKGNGDFRSAECIELLKQADIVVTNPPFSLFREYMAQLMEYGKQFLIIGNQNAITYKEIFPLLRDNRVWLGTRTGHTLFMVPDDYTVPDFYDMSDKSKLRSNGYVFIDGKLWRNLGNICWFTNLDHKKRHEPLDLYKTYSPEEYPHYDNYDAIEVSKVAEMPYDYDGVMGVPVSFLDKYCPEQFEMLDMLSSAGGGAIGCFQPNEYGQTIKDKRPILKGKNTYARILIRKRK